MKKDNTKKEIVQITPENIKDLNIGVGSVIKDDRGDYWKITKADDFYANMHICDKDGNEIENFVGNAGRSAFGGGLTGLLNDGVAIYYIETESPEITENPLSHVNFYVTEFAEFPTYNDTENMSLPEAVSFMRQANSTKDNESKVGTPTCFTIGLEIDGERFGNDGSSYNPLTGEFDTLMYEANSLFRKYGGHALNAIVEEIEKQNKELPENKKMPCNFNRADFGLEEKNESPVSPSEIEEEKQFIQKRIQWLKDTLNNPDRNSPDDEHFISDTKENIERLENLTEEDFKKMVLWKKQNQKNNKETHRQVAEMMNYIQTIKNAPDDGSLLSFNEMNPTHTLFNKDTGRTTSIQPFGKLEENVRKLGRLKNLTEANNVIEKIKSNGFDILSTQFRVVIYNENTFYDFDTYADSGKWNYKAENFEHNLDRRNLKDWDFKKYIDGGLKITKEMKEFEKIGIYDNTPFAGLSKEEVGKICFGLWEAEDKGLMDYHEENFPGDKYPSYPGDDFVTEYLLNNKDKYNFSELKEYFLDTNKIEIKPVTLEEILDVMEFNLEPQKNGTFKIFDRQLGEYKDNKSLLPDTDENNWTFTNAAEIFERLDIYINDYFIHDMEERLEEGGVTLRGDETLEDLCACAKQQLEAGITTVSEGELNLAMGIVHPETVIMPESLISQEQISNHLKEPDEKTNYILEKLAKAGIEVVTDKDEFEKNPDIMNSEVAVHEYTHLWDNYIQKTNPGLWKKGLQIFEGTSLWNDVLNDENYVDIKNDKNLVLSEVHSRICGKIADSVLQKVLEWDGNMKQAEMIDWDKEVDKYIYENFESSRTLSNGKEIESTGYGAFGLVVNVNEIRSWFAQPMKDLMNGLRITQNIDNSPKPNNLNHNLSWKELGLNPEDYESYGNIPSDETEFKEWALALQLENELDLRGFDTGLENVSNEDNSRISEQKWVILDELSHRIVSGELPYELHNYDYSNQQKEYDRLLKENPVFQELTSKGVIKANFENPLSGNIELTADDLKNAKALLPKEQYQLVLSYTQGEEGDHFKEIIKNISTKAEEIKGKSEILTEDEKHPLAFKYTLGNSSFYFSEWDGNDELFGYAVLNGDTQNSEWGYKNLEELKNSRGRDGNGFPVLPEMTFYGLEKTIEKQISVDYPALSEKMGFSRKKNHNEQLISEFGKEIFETLENRKLEYSAYNICCAAQFVLRTMDSSERKEVFELMEKCGCQGKDGKENTEDFLTKCVLAENKTANSEYIRKQLYEKINKACEQKNRSTGKNVHNQNNDYEREI